MIVQIISVKDDLMKICPLYIIARNIPVKSRNHNKLSYAKISSSRKTWILVEASIFFFWQGRDYSGKF